MKLIKIFTLSFITIALALMVGVLDPGPDSKLYIAVSENLAETGAYEDIIRNDEILPSIGHPIILLLAKTAFNDYKAITLLFVFSSFAVVALLVHSLFNSFIVTIACQVVFYFLITGTIISAGVEGSVLFFYILTTILAIKLVTEKEVNIGLIVTFSLLLAIATLIRPVALYLVPVVGVIGLFLIVKHRNVKYLSFFLAPVIMLFGFGYSSLTYNDSRIVTGTYGAIPLYSGMNEYIDLDKNYYSSNWKAIPESRMVEGVKPYKNVDGWVARDKHLKNLVLEFVFENPSKAISTIWGRAMKYSFYSERQMYSVVAGLLLLSIVIGFFIFGLEYFPLGFLSLGLAVYFTGIQSLFAYSGERYLITNISVLTPLLIANIHFLCFKFKLRCSSFMWKKLV